jgi:hypothetical protein
VVEALAIRRVVAFAQEEDLFEIIRGLDCLSVIQCINSLVTNWSQTELVIVDIKFCSN